MSSRTPIKQVSCNRCKAKKIRCNRVDPRCDKCEAVGAECIYLPRKARVKRPREFYGPEVIYDILKRLERLENQSGIDQTQDDEDVSSPQSPMSINPDTTENGPDASWPDNSTSSCPRMPEPVIRMLNTLEDKGTKAQLSNILFQLRYAGPSFAEHVKVTRALEEAITKIICFEKSAENNSAATPLVPKELAKKWVNLSFEAYQFEVFRIPLGKDFVMSIPDLLEIRHVKLDATSLIIYYTCLFHGVTFDRQFIDERGVFGQYFYRKVMELIEQWLEAVQNTDADLYAAFALTSLLIYACNIELAWEVFEQVCKISRGLGHFSVDKIATPGVSVDAEHNKEQNRKRFEFWHILRMDCMFRLHFGKPSLISPDSWTVNFPDPSITGIDDDSTRFIQIHFLATMRLTLVMLKYLGLTKVEAVQNPTAYNNALENLSEEVLSIMSNWQAEDLLDNLLAKNETSDFIQPTPKPASPLSTEKSGSSNNQIDSWFCADLLFDSYKALIILEHSKCNYCVSTRTVRGARKSMKTMQSMVESTPNLHWGTSMILLHLSVPFFTLCSKLVASADRNDIDEDLALVNWMNDFTKFTAANRVELRPLKIIIEAMCSACERA